MRIACRLAALPAALAGRSAPAWSAGMLLEPQASGFQVWNCQASAWRLKAPDAVLRDRSGAEIGRHSAGPTWQDKDGSAVVGEILAPVAASQAGAIPWLLARARSHAGQGVFAPVGHIVRTRTKAV